MAVLCMRESQPFRYGSILVENREGKNIHLISKENENSEMNDVTHRYLVHEDSLDRSAAGGNTTSISNQDYPDDLLPLEIPGFLNTSGSYVHIHLINTCIFPHSVHIHL